MGKGTKSHACILVNFIKCAYCQPGGQNTKQSVHHKHLDMVILKLLTLMYMSLYSNIDSFLTKLKCHI